MNHREFEQKIRSIRRAGRGLTPDPAWVSRTRETLMMQVENSMSVTPVSFWRRVRETVRPVAHSFRLMSFFRRQVIATISIFGLVAGGSIASVSAADNSVPGDFLYPVKLAAEQTQLALTSDKSEKLKLKTEFVGRRVEEIKSIVTSKVGQKTERIQEAAEIMKRDLDTMNTQLVEVTKQDSANASAQSAKLVDLKSTELVDALKDMKASLPDAAARSKVAEASVAAVNTGVKAVQVLIDTKDQPDAKGVVTNDELVLSIHQKVQGLQDNVVDAAQKMGVTITVSTSTSESGAASSTAVVAIVQTAGAASSSVAQITSAQEALVQTKQLLQENKLEEISNKLFETTKAIVSVEKEANAVVASAVSSTQMGTASSTPAVGSVTTTAPMVLPLTTSTKPNP